MTNQNKGPMQGIIHWNDQILRRSHCDEASHEEEEKSYTLQTHINTDLEDHRTLLHRTKLTYIHTHIYIRTFIYTFNFLQSI